MKAIGGQLRDASPSPLRAAVIGDYPFQFGNYSTLCYALCAMSCQLSERELLVMLFCFLIWALMGALMSDAYAAVYPFAILLGCAPEGALPGRVYERGRRLRCSKMMPSPWSNTLTMTAAAKEFRHAGNISGQQSLCLRKHAFRPTPTLTQNA